MKLLFFSFRLIFATTQPSAQDSVSTSSEIISVRISPPATAPGAAETVNQ